MTPRSPLGINARNSLIRRVNSRTAIRAARDKLVTKHLLSQRAIPSPPTLDVIRTRQRADRVEPSEWGTDWVMKPSRGSQGRGVLVNHGATVAERARRHARAIIEGQFSNGTDVALIEPLLSPHRELRLCSIGLPDVRVICLDGTARMAMLRLPTVGSAGRSNLHQGGIGAALDLASGRVAGARHRGHPITTHPDTGIPLSSVVVPFWTELLAIAEQCGPAIGLGYVGVDVVVVDGGPLVLEVNGHPGLEIQNICGEPIDVDRAVRRRRW